VLLMSHEENALLERPRRNPDREGVPDHEGNSPQRRKL
jgi:hypothetical protein